MHQTEVKCYFWVCLWRCFQKRFAFDSVEWRRGCLHQGRCGSSNPFKACDEKQRWKKVNLLCAELRHPFSPSLSHPAPVSWAPFGLWPRLWTLLLWFSELQVCTGTTPTASCCRQLVDGRLCSKSPTCKLSSSGLSKIWMCIPSVSKAWVCSLSCLYCWYFLFYHLLPPLPPPVQ